MRASLLILLSVGLCCLAGSRAGYAQVTDSSAYTLTLRGVPLQEALEELVRLTQIDLVYNSDLVNDTPVYCADQMASVEALLQCVLAGSGLDYIRSSAGTYVLIEAREQPARYGDLAGSIVDEETGEPLPYANVLLADASTGTTTDGAGFFSFSSVLTGIQRVMVTYVGYETTIDSVWVAPGTRQRLEIALRARTIAMGPVVIDGLTQRLPSRALGQGEITDHRLEALNTVGTPDVVRGAGTLTGVAQLQPLADLHIQGGASGEHLTHLDGVPVRDPVSLGRHLGAFSPLAINRLTVHKAGFGAEHGSHLSGVVAVEHDVAGAERQNVVVSADPVSLNGKVQGRFTLPGVQQGTAMVALRTSVWDIYQAPGVESLLRHWDVLDPMFASRWLNEEVSTATLITQRPDPQVSFSDVHAAVRLHLSPFHTLHASGYRAGNNIASELLTVNSDGVGDQDRLVLARDDYDWTNWATQVRHSWLIGARSIATLQAQGAWHQSRYTYHALQDSTPPLTTPEALEDALTRYQAELDTRGPGSDERHQIRELAGNAQLSHSLSPRHHVEAGLTVSHIDSRFLLGNQFVAPFRHVASTWQYAGYVKSNLSLGLALTLEPSLRLAYLPTRQTVYAEPRLTVRYDRAASRIGPFAVRLAGGVYRQFVNQFELTSSGATAVVPSILFWLPIDRTLAPPRVYHLASEVLFMPDPAWTISLEAYFKEQPRLLVLDYATLVRERPTVRPLPPPETLDQDDFIAATRGRTYGGSLRVRRATGRLITTATYSFSHALRRFPGRFDERMETVPWNEPHRLALDAGLTLFEGFTVDANWQGAWGRRWALRRAYYDYLALRLDPAAFGSFDPNQPSDQKVSPYYSLDVGVTYERTWGGATVQVRAFLVNVLDRNNVYDQSLEQTDAGVGQVARTLPGRHPIFSLRLDY